MLPEMVTGRYSGTDFPTTIEALHKAGPEFLTRALQSVGTLPADDQIVAITRAEEFVGGGMGRKLLLDVEYAKGKGLDRDLFVKFPLDYGHPLRDFFTPPMDAEVRFYLQSIRSQLPINVPTAYFADYDPVSLSGITITKRLAYGKDGVEPCLEKCQDHTLADPLEYYMAMTTAIATLAGAHRAGRLSDDVETRFPKPPAADGRERFLYSKEDMTQKVAKIRQFAAEAPQLLPESFLETAFLDHFEASAMLMLDYDEQLIDILNTAEDFIALTHWNANLDNAWFWRDEKGQLQVGLIDWGNAGQINLARSFWGMACAAELDFLNTHRTTLMQNLVERFHEAGGPEVSVADFDEMYRLAIAVDAMAWMADAPSIIEANLPNFSEMTGREDPRLQSCFLAMGQLHIMTVMLNEVNYADLLNTIPRALAAPDRFRQ